MSCEIVPRRRHVLTGSGLAQIHHAAAHEYRAPAPTARPAKRICAELNAKPESRAHGSPVVTTVSTADIVAPSNPITSRAVAAEALAAARDNDHNDTKPQRIKPRTTGAGVSV
jgi:hypothetical protein